MLLAQFKALQMESGAHLGVGTQAGPSVGSESVRSPCLNFLPLPGVREGQLKGLPLLGPGG